MLCFYFYFQLVCLVSFSFVRFLFAANNSWPWRPLFILQILLIVFFYNFSLVMFLFLPAPSLSPRWQISRSLRSCISPVHDGGGDGCRVVTVIWWMASTGAQQSEAMRISRPIPETLKSFRDGLVGRPHWLLFVLAASGSPVQIRFDNRTRTSCSRSHGTSSSIRTRERSRERAAWTLPAERLLKRFHLWTVSELSLNSWCWPKEKCKKCLETSWIDQKEAEQVKKNHLNLEKRN